MRFLENLKEKSKEVFYSLEVKKMLAKERWQEIKGNQKEIIAPLK